MRPILAITSRALMSMAIALWLPAADAAGELLPQGSIVSKATGEIEMSPSRDSPIYVEFVGSPTLSARLAESLTSMGFVVVPNRDAAVASLSMRGDIALQGGPDFARGVKAPMGESAEKAIAFARSKGEVTSAEVVQGAMGTAINAAGFNAAVTPFWKAYYLGNLVNVLAESSGIKGEFNKALTGDPRGICLSRCADWNKVNQTAYVWIKFQAADSTHEVRGVTKAFAEMVAPDQVMDRALADAVATIRIADEKSQTGSAK